MGALFESPSNHEKIKQIKMSGVSIIVGELEIGAVGIIIAMKPKKRKSKPLKEISATWSRLA